MEWNKPTKFKRIQFLTSPFRGKHLEELKTKTGQSTSPQKFYVPLNLSAEEAWQLVKAYFGIGKQKISEEQETKDGKIKTIFKYILYVIIWIVAVYVLGSALGSLTWLTGRPGD